MEGKGTCGVGTSGDLGWLAEAGEARERKVGEGGADGGNERGGIVVW